MKKNLFQLLIIILLSIFNVNAQSTHTIMSYNLLNYPGIDTTIRNPHFRTVFSSIQPDILVVQELQSIAGVNGFLNNVLNISSSGYSAGLFVDGFDSDRAIFYKGEHFTFISNTPIKTALRDINEFKVLHKLTQDTLRIYAVHLKASSGTDNEQKRLAEVTELRKVTDLLPANANFIVLGDFNIYSSYEPAFIKLLDKSTSGYFIDPLNLTGIFNQFAYAPYHTQSTRTRSFGDGATGGLDDRFDMILISQSVKDSGGVTYIVNSTRAHGNDGNHYNDSINRPTNSAVGQLVADALHYASDHLPVYASFKFDLPVSVNYEFTASVPDEYILYQNYPNPFNPVTVISYSLSVNSNVSLKVFDVLGREVAVLVNEDQMPGKYEVDFNAADLPSGVYMYRITAGNYSETMKMILLK